MQGLPGKFRYGAWHDVKFVQHCFAGFPGPRTCSTCHEGPAITLPEIILVRAFLRVLFGERATKGKITHFVGAHCLSRMSRCFHATSPPRPRLKACYRIPSEAMAGVWRSSRRSNSAGAFRHTSPSRACLVRLPSLKPAFCRTRLLELLRLLDPPFFSAIVLFKKLAISPFPGFFVVF